MPDAVPPPRLEWYPSFNPDPCSVCGRSVIVDDAGICKRCAQLAARRAGNEA